MLGFIGQVADGLWVAALLCLVAMVLALRLGSRTDNGWYWLASIVAGIAALVLVVCICIIGSMRHYGRIGCANFARETGYEVKFRVLSTGSGGTCLVHISNGRWVPKEQVGDYVPVLGPGGQSETDAVQTRTAP